VFGFLGPNRAGKTTTIRILLGLMEPTSGSDHVLGFDTQSQGAEIRARTGALLEHSGVYEHLSAEDNLEFFGRVYRMPAKERHDRTNCSFIIHRTNRVTSEKYRLGGCSNSFHPYIHRC